MTRAASDKAAGRSTRARGGCGSSGVVAVARERARTAQRPRPACAARRRRPPCDAVGGRRARAGLGTPARPPVTGAAPRHERCVCAHRAEGAFARAGARRRRRGDREVRGAHDGGDHGARAPAWAEQAAGERPPEADLGLLGSSRARAATTTDAPTPSCRCAATGSRASVTAADPLDCRCARLERVRDHRSRNPGRGSRHSRDPGACLRSARCGGCRRQRG